MKNLPELKAFLGAPKKVAIVTHFKPDADALGSSLGLAGFLRKKGHQVDVITPSDYPDFLSWMPGADEVTALSKRSKDTELRSRLLLAQAEIIFCLDFSSLSRINDLGDLVKKSNAIKVMIDHHLEPEHFADYEKWNVTDASTAQLVYDFIVSLGEKKDIDTSIANCLYAGLMTDTGGFRHNNTTAREFKVAEELTSLGANPSEVARLVYETNSLGRLRLTGFALSEKLVVLTEYRTAYVTLSQEELRRFDVQTGDTEGLVNYGLSIKDVQLSVLMYDRGEEIKISFRSLGAFSVNDMARTHFQGGGHRNASGGSSKESLERTLERFLKIL
ncbi:MAG TPA: bifunctional oligoribonuclease/PAP phosphatase NrnA, partial [Cyclobacteriaceae bacterium]|nr:bifunctional oligoribonuclease/PAP phosphatase NrnA [Cyclobacteriaceae bacterium]